MRFIRRSPGGLTSKEPARRAARAAGTDTVILIQVSELGPHFVISLPALWSGSTEVRLRFRAIEAKTGNILLDIERRRSVGGAYAYAYAIKSVDDLEAEMVTVLRGLIGG